MLKNGRTLTRRTLKNVVEEQKNVDCKNVDSKDVHSKIVDCKIVDCKKRGVKDR
jgi:hypothetical protein